VKKDEAEEEHAEVEEEPEAKEEPKTVSEEEPKAEATDDATDTPQPSKPAQVGDITQMVYENIMVILKVFACSQKIMALGVGTGRRDQSEPSTSPHHVGCGSGGATGIYLR
jgi:hypothetical protein